MERYTDGVLCRSVGQKWSDSKVGERQDVFVVTDQFLETLHGHGCLSNWSVVEKTAEGGLFGQIGADFRHGGMKDWDSDSLKILGKTLASWSAHSLKTLPVTPSGLAAFLGFTALSGDLTSCSCTVLLELLKLLQFSGRAAAAFGPSTSKRAKKQPHSSASTS